MKHLLAKVFGWAQFAIVSGAQLTQGGMPKNWREWVQLIGSGAIAVALHASASTDGTK